MPMKTLAAFLVTTLVSSACNTTTMGSPIAGRRVQAPDRSAIEWTPLRVENGELVLDYFSVEGRGSAQIRNVLLRFESAAGKVLQQVDWDEDGRSSFVYLGRMSSTNEAGIRVNAVIKYMGGEETRIQLR